VHVNNVAPTVTAPSAQSSNEGENHSFDLGSFSDPGSDSPWSVSVDWGEASGVAVGPKSHTYADGPNDFTVHVTVTDKDGGADTKTFAVHVNNVAPTVRLDPSNDQSVDEGTTHTYKYTVSDPGIYDTFTVDTNYPSCGTNGTVTGTPTTT